jgi:hypothetical protein
VFGSPVADEGLDLRQLHALGLIVDTLAWGPPRRRQPSAEIDQFLFRNVDAEGADCQISPAVPTWWSFLSSGDRDATGAVQAALRSDDCNCACVWDVRVSIALRAARRARGSPDSGGVPRGEPSAGRWHTWVLSSAQQIAVPAPRLQAVQTFAANHDLEIAGTIPFDETFASPNGRVSRRWTTTPTRRR